MQELQAKVQAELAQVATWQSQVQGGLRLWNQALLTDQIAYSTQDSQLASHEALPQTSLARADLLPSLRQSKEFLETLARFNTPGTTVGNWRWRLPSWALDAERAAWFARLNLIYGRA